jgi:hypothetical protein
MRNKNFKIPQLQIIMPSMGGSLAALAFGIGALIIGQLPSFRQKLDASYIPQAISNLQHSIGHAIISLLTHSLHGYADNLFLVLFWVIIGIVIYSLLRGMGSIFLDLEEDLEERAYLWPSYADRNKHLRMFGVKLGFRVAIIILLLLYGLVLVPKILHHLNNQLNGRDSLHTALHSLLYLAIAGLLAQIFIILLRLLVLRPRLF